MLILINEQAYIYCKLVWKGVKVVIIDSFRRIHILILVPQKKTMYKLYSEN